MYILCIYIYHISHTESKMMLPRCHRLDGSVASDFCGFQTFPSHLAGWGFCGFLLFLRLAKSTKTHHTKGKHGKTTSKI